MKRILLVLLSLILAFSYVVSADQTENQAILEEYMSDSIDMERVYKYDFYEKLSTEDQNGDAPLKYSNAVKVALALELMKPDDEGKFNEDEFVSYTEFANIIMMLTTGTIDSISKQYQSYPTTRYATQHEAAYYLVGALGYGIYDSRYAGDNPRSVCAQRIKLLRDIEFSGDKNITRGELSQMIYNAFQIDIIEQSAIGSNMAEFETIEGNTLLKQRFDAILLDDAVVTAQNGFDMYPSGNLEDNQIKINNAVYGIDGEVLNDDYLGHRVMALVRKNTNTDLYDVICIDFNQDDTTVCISGENIERVSNNNLHYMVDGSEKKLGLSSIKRIVVNGAPKTSTQFASLINSGFEGELRLCSETGKGSINSIVAYQYETFKLNNVSVLNEKINFADNRTYKGQKYIDVNRHVKLFIQKDGVRATLSDLTPGTILNIAGNSDDSAFVIKASTAVVEGTVSSMDEDNIWIGSKVFSLSKAYEQSLITNPELPIIRLGSTGKFLLDSGNRIVGFSQTQNKYSYGFMTEIDGITSRNKTIRVYTTDRVWVTYELDDNLTLDGIAGMSKKDAFEVMMNNESEICGDLIRYRLSSENKIKFLDTVIQNDAEKSDNESLKKGPLWEDKFNWTAGSQRIVLSGTSYSVTKNAQVFTVPSNLEDESKGFSCGNPAFISETSGKLQLYNVDDYGFSELVVSMSDSRETNYEDIYAYAVVTGKRVYIDEDDEETLGLEVFDGTNNPYWVERSLRVDEFISDKAKELNKGDVIIMDTSGNELRNFKKIFAGDVLKQDAVTTTVTGRQERLAYVTDVNAERGLVKIQSGDELLICTISNLGLYETATGQCSPLEIGDVQAGDRVLCIVGSSLYARILVIR